MIAEIKTLNDVKAFATHLLEVEKLSFHPDDDFKDYMTSEGKPFYSENDANLRNKLMDDCFDVCQKAGSDVYSIVYPIVHQQFKIIYE